MKNGAPDALFSKSHKEEKGEGLLLSASNKRCCQRFICRVYELHCGAAAARAGSNLATPLIILQGEQRRIA